MKLIRSVQLYSVFLTKGMARWRPEGIPGHRTGALVLIVILGATLALGQGSPAGTTSNNTPVGMVRGRILDADSGQPVTQTVRVSVSNGPETVRPVDGNGEYVVRDLAPGLYHIDVAEPGNRFPIGQRIVNVRPDVEVSGADVYVRFTGTLSGTLLDEDRDPVPKAKVMLVAMEYWWGRLIYYAKKHTYTDDRGQYNFSRVDAGRSYLLLALPPERKGVDNSTGPDSAMEPESRRPVMAASWYPGPPASVGQMEFVLRSGEQKRIDLQMAHATSYCADGSLTVDGRPAAFDFALAVKETSGYAPGNGFDRGDVGTGRSGTDGRFRICGLWPGDFRLTAHSSSMQYGYAFLSVSNKDLHSIALDVRSPITVTGDATWDKPPRDSTGVHLMSLMFSPVSRPTFGIQDLHYAVDVDVPGSFKLTVPAMTEYSLMFGGRAIAYFKEVLCSGAALTSRVFNSAEGDCKLQVTLSTDAGTVGVKVVDKENNPLPNTWVCMVPASAETRDQVAGGTRCSPTDPEAASGSFRLPPGKYFALARNWHLTTWPLSGEGAFDVVEELWSQRTQGVAVEVTPDSSAQLTLIVKPADH